MTEGEPVEQRHVVLVALVRRGGLEEGEPPRLLRAIRDALVRAGADDLTEARTADGWVLRWHTSPTSAVEGAAAVRRQFGWHRAVGIGIARTAAQAQQLGRRSSGAMIIADGATYDAVREHVVARPSRRNRAVLISAVRESDETRVIDWHRYTETAALIIGAAAGLAIWVTLVGGMTMWARLHRANVPETQGVAVLPRQVLLAEGLRVLLVTLGIALFVALAAFEASSERLAPARAKGAEVTANLLRRGIEWLTFRRAAFVVIVLLLVSVAVSEWLHVKLRGVPPIAAVAAVAFVLLVWAFRHFAPRRRRTALAITVFAVVFSSAGLIGIFRELWSEKLRLDSAAVTVEGVARPWTALYIARTGDTLYVARRGDEDPACRIQVLRNDTVRDLRIRERGSDAFCPEEKDSAVTGPTTTVTVTKPGETVTVADGIVTIIPETVTLPAETVPVTVAAATVTQTETEAVERPAGAHRLPDGTWSIPVASARLPMRLGISAPTYSREPLRDTRPLTATFRISATGGYAVEGARVYVRALRATYFAAAEATSNEHGIAHVRLYPTEALPFGQAARIALFVRAWNPDEPKTGGVSQRRLVQLRLGPRTAARR